MQKMIRLSFTVSLALMVFAGCARAEKPQILVFAGTKGFFHTSIPKGMRTLQDLCNRNDMVADTTRDAAAFTDENLKKYKVVVFLNTTGDVLDDTQQAAFERYIHAGGGFVGIHAATDTEYDWPWYNKLVGAQFRSHPQQQDAIIRVTDRNNPATADLPEAWKRNDEWYNFKSISKDIHVLAYLDEKSYWGGANGAKHPFIWCQEFEGGRAFYTGVGHRDDNYDEPLVQQHLVGAIRWAGRI
jgi:cytochrome c